MHNFFSMSHPVLGSIGGGGRKCFFCCHGFSLHGAFHVQLYRLYQATALILIFSSFGCGHDPLNIVY